MVVNNLKKTNTILFFCFMVVAGLILGASILIPFTFAIFFSTFLVPVSNFIEDKTGFGRITSSLISTLLLLIGVGAIFFLLFRQLGVFLNDLVERKEDILAYVGVLQEEIMESTGFTVQEQQEMIKDRLSNIFQFLQGFVSGILSDITGMVLQFLLVLIYVFLLLINRTKFVDFLMKYIPGDKKHETYEILNETGKVAYKYLWGRIQVMFLLGIMYTITFYSYGLEHAPLLIIFGVIITIIPYVGPLISGLLPILFMMIFGGSSFEILSFSIIVVIIQLIESYILEPVIIGSEVQQSPLFVIISIIIGGAIWGPAGLVLFVPLFGILKIIFDHNKELKPLGTLMGYERRGSGEGFLEKIKRKLK